MTVENFIMNKIESAEAEVHGMSLIIDTLFISNFFGKQQKKQSSCKKKQQKETGEQL